MLTWLPQVLPAMSKLPQPINLTLNSSHFNHLLKWEPGPGTPTGVYYSVTVKAQTGTSWMPVAGCEHVQHPLVCNLTEAFSEPEQVYFTRIEALLKAQDSQEVVLPGFQPIRDTQLDLPWLTVTPCGKDLCVDLQPPMGHLREYYDSLNYKLRIRSNNANGAQFFEDNKSLKRKILKDLASGRQYCVSVCFLDSHVPRESNYSQPVCAVTAGYYTADPLISALLCLLVISGVGVVALLISTGFICLRKRPLPSVLTTIHHIEERLVAASCSTSLSSLWNIKPTLPSSGEKRSTHTSDESDGESVTEITGGSTGGGYKLRLGADFHSSSFSSSSSLSAPLSPKPELLQSLNRASDFLSPQPECSTETHSIAGLREPLSAYTALHFDSLPKTDQGSDPCPADADELTVRIIQSNEEEKDVVGEEDNQDVNLLSLTFGRPEEGEEEEEVEKSHCDLAELSSALEVYNTIVTLPSLDRNTKEVAIETVSCTVDEEEVEEEGEHSGYMVRPCQYVLENLF